MADPQAVVAGFWDWKIGDVATWAGAVGSAAAAGAAFVAAKIALKIAGDARKDAAAQLHDQARTLAKALGYELRRAAEEIKDVADLAERGATGAAGPGDMRSTFHPGVLTRTTALALFLGRLECFGAADGASLASACSTVLNIKAQISAWHYRVGPAISLSFDEGERRGLVMLEAEGRMAIEQIRALQPVLERYGGGKTPYEA